MKDHRLAIIDLYNGIDNQGMRCIRDIAHSFRYQMDYEVFDVRQTAQVPEVDEFDLYIFSGGPGDPRNGEGVAGWEAAVFGLMDELFAHNRNSEEKKFVFFICHSFQMAVHHLGLAEVTERKSMSFGTFPVHRTPAGREEVLFNGLGDPFQVADFRRYQVVQPDEERLTELGAEVLCLEKKRPHVPLERAIMAIRFSPEIFGTQFHPEADAMGMLKHFQRQDIMLEVINEHGKKKYASMMRDLNHPGKIERTNATVLPRFLERSIAALKEQRRLVEA